MKKALIVLMAFLILLPSVIVANSMAEKPRLRIEPFILWGYNDSDMETIITMLSMQDSLRMAYNIVANDAEYVLVTDVRRLGDATVLMMRILNVNDSSQIANGNLTFHAITEIVEQIPQVAARLAAPVLARLPAPSSVIATPVAAPSAVDDNDDGDISPASIAQLVGDLVRNTVGGRFGETVGNAVANIVVEQVRTRLSQIGISADNDVGQIVGDIVAQTVSQEVAKNVPGPAGRMGGERVGKAVGETVARQVNNLIAGVPLDFGADESGGRRNINTDEFDPFVVLKWMPMIEGNGNLAGFNLEFGQIRGNGWWWSIDGGATINDEMYGGTFNLGGVYEFANKMHFAYGGSVGFWMQEQRVRDKNNPLRDYRWRDTYGYFGPIVKWRWQFFEVAYRGLIGDTYINQVMVGFYLSSNRRREILPQGEVRYHQTNRSGRPTDYVVDKEF